MGQRQDKKLRKELRKSAKEIAEEHKLLIANHLKPKPTWIPWKVWLWAIGFFIDYKRVKPEGK